MVAPLALRGFTASLWRALAGGLCGVVVGCYAASCRASKKPLSRHPAEAAHRGPGCGGNCFWEVFLCPAGKEHSSPPRFRRGGRGGNVDRNSNSFKSLMPPAGRDCAPSPLCWEIGQIFRGHRADRGTDFHARWIEIGFEVLY